MNAWMVVKEEEVKESLKGSETGEAEECSVPIRQLSTMRLKLA